MPMRLLATSKRRRAQETQTLLPEGRAEREVTGARPGLNTSHGKLWGPWGPHKGVARVLTTLASFVHGFKWVLRLQAGGNLKLKQPTSRSMAAAVRPLGSARATSECKNRAS